MVPDGHVKQLSFARLMIRQGIAAVLAIHLLSSAAWSADSSVVLQVRIDGQRLYVYGEQLLVNPDHKVYFGSQDLDYLFEPRLLDKNESRIKLLLPFQPVPGRYWLKIGPNQDDPATEVSLLFNDPRVTIELPGVAKTALGADLSEDGASAVQVVNVDQCPESGEKCLTEDDGLDNVFCGSAASFNPREGSQAMTVSNSQELHLDDEYTVEARVFIQEYVRGGILVDKYSGSGRGREYRLSIGKDGLLRGWFTPDGTLVDDFAIYSNIQVPKNRWTHVAYTNESGQLRLFIDGAVVAEKQVRGRPAQLGYQNVAIGGNNCCPGYYEVINGLIDEVRISDTARYAGSFEPPRREFDPDPHTLLLLHFTAGGENVGLIGDDVIPSEFHSIVSCAAT